MESFNSALYQVIRKQSWNSNHHGLSITDTSSFSLFQLLLSSRRKLWKYLKATITCTSWPLEKRARMPLYQSSPLRPRRSFDVRSCIFAITFYLNIRYQACKTSLVLVTNVSFLGVSVYGVSSDKNTLITAGFLQFLIYRYSRS